MRWTVFYKCPKCNQKYITRASNYCMKCGVEVNEERFNEYWYNQENNIEK